MKKGKLIAIVGMDLICNFIDHSFMCCKGYLNEIFSIIGRIDVYKRQALQVVPVPDCDLYGQENG